MGLYEAHYVSYFRYHSVVRARRHLASAVNLRRGRRVAKRAFIHPLRSHLTINVTGKSTLKTL